MTKMKRISTLVIVVLFLTALVPMMTNWQTPEKARWFGVLKPVYVRNNDLAPTVAKGEQALFLKIDPAHVEDGDIIALSNDGQIQLRRAMTIDGNLRAKAPALPIPDGHSISESNLVGKYWLGFPVWVLPATIGVLVLMLAGLVRSIHKDQKAEVNNHGR